MTSPVDTVAPAVIELEAALTRALPAPPAEDAVRVFVGVDINREWVPRALVVAASFDEDISAISVDRRPSGARPHFIETVSVACSLYVGDAGKPKFETWRTTAGEILGVLDTALRKDAALKAVVPRARRGFTRWIDWLDEDGGRIGVICDFVVELMAIT